jgi:hypothetical protein
MDIVCFIQVVDIYDVMPSMVSTLANIIHWLEIMFTVFRRSALFRLQAEIEEGEEMSTQSGLLSKDSPCYWARNKDRPKYQFPLPASLLSEHGDRASTHSTQLERVDKIQRTSLHSDTRSPSQTFNTIAESRIAGKIDRRKHGFVIFKNCGQRGEWIFLCDDGLECEV